MNNKSAIIFVVSIFTVGYIIIPFILGFFISSSELIAVIQFVSTLPIPLFLIIKLADIPMGEWKLIRLIGISYIIFSIVEVCFSFQEYLPSKFLGIVLLIKMGANLFLFIFSFIVTKHLILYNRAGIFMLVTSLLLYLRYSTWVQLIFRVIDDYDQQTASVTWNTWYWYGNMVFFLGILVFVFQTLMLDSLLREYKQI